MRPETDTPPFPSLFFFFAPVPSPESRPVSRSISPLRAAPTAPLAATPPARAARTRGPISATRRRTRPRTRRPTGPGEASAVGCSRRSRTSPRVRDARAPAVASPTERAAALASRSSPRKNSPSRAARSRAGARASSSSSSSCRRRRRIRESTDARRLGLAAASPRRTRGNSRRRFGRRWRTFVAGGRGERVRDGASRDVGVCSL